MTNVRTIRNVIIILALAAIVAVVPGGGTGSSVVLQAVWLAFLAAFVWVGTIMYREHRTELYSLGDRKRAALYAALATLVVDPDGHPPAVGDGRRLGRLARARRRRRLRGRHRALVGAPVLSASPPAPGRTLPPP